MKKKIFDKKTIKVNPMTSTMAVEKQKMEVEAPVKQIRTKAPSADPKKILEAARKLSKFAK